jgi:sugar phosphate permease
MRRRELIFAIFALAYFLSYFFRSANAVIARDLSGELGLSAAQLGLMTSLFYATFALVQLPIGVGLDRLGPRLVTAGMLLWSVAGALIFASAQSFGALALGRALIGVGMAGVLMGAFKAFGHWYPSNRLATITGFMVGIGASGGLAAATPLAWLNGVIGWRAIFGWGALCILAAAALIALGTRDAPPNTPLQRSSGALGGFGLIFHDLRFWRIAPLIFCMLGTPLAVQTLWGGPFLNDVLRLDSIAVGNVLLAMGLGTVLGYFSCGWLADRYGAKRVSMLATLALLACQVPFALQLVLPVAPWQAIYFVFGYAGAFNIVLLAQTRALFPSHMSGRAATAINMFAFGGAGLIQWWMGLIIDRWPRDAAGFYPPAAYSAAFSVTLLGTLLALLWYLPFGRARVARPVAGDAAS